MSGLIPVLETKFNRAFKIHISSISFPFLATSNCSVTQLLSKSLQPLGLRAACLASLIFHHLVELAPNHVH